MKAGHTNYRLLQKVQLGQEVSYTTMQNHIYAAMLLHGGEPDSQARRCRALWCEVILNAVREADGRIAGTDGRGSHRQYSINNARAWFEGNSRDFRLVCELAGFDPGQVRAAWLDGRLCADAIKEARKAMGAEGV